MSGSFFFVSERRYETVSSETSAPKTPSHYISISKQVSMSALKTHEVFTVIESEEVLCANSDEETVQIKSLVVSRTHPSRCQVFTQKENIGSMSSPETKVYNGVIETIRPSADVTEFDIKARVNSEVVGLTLKTVPSKSSDCCVM